MEGQSELKWNKGIPTKDGWYWFRGETGRTRVEYWDGSNQYLRGYLRGWFAGPLEPPVDEQR